jgi:hypothetical protein
MHDRDTVLTDFFLVALCAGFVLVLVGADGLALLYALLFAALGAAALAGALWHGWFPGAQAGLGGALWLGVLLAIGVANLALWLIAGQIMDARLLAVVGWGQFVLFAGLAVFVNRGFLLASAFSLPPVLVLIAAHGWKLAEGGGPSHALGLAGFATAMAGAGLQAARIGLPAFGLGHNALYHLVQALAFTLVFLSV